MNKLQAIELEEIKESYQGFKVETKEQAAWAMRKIAALESTISENNALAQSEIDRINEWLAGENKSANEAINFFSGLLEQYMRAANKEHDKIKSIKVPKGTFGLRAQQPSFTWEEKLVLEYLKTSNPEMVKRETIVVEKFDKNEVKKIIDSDFTIHNELPVHKETGDIIPGIKIVEQEPKFYVKPILD